MKFRAITETPNNFSAKTSAKTKFWIVVFIFLMVYGFLIAKIPWSEVFSPTTVAGGDTGSHNYVAYYATQIFPKLKWWSPDWYAGFPFLYFYPPLLYYLTAILNLVIPWTIALKICTLLGTLLLPIAVYYCLKQLNFEFPIPSLGSALSLLFLFLEAFNIYGGNLPSTLAGEFSYSFALALFFIFIGLLSKDFSEKKRVIPLILILSLMVLSHPFSVIVAVLTAAGFFLVSLLNKNRKSNFIYLAKIFGGAFCLTAFWSLPFLGLMSYTAKMSWTKEINLNNFFPSVLIIWQLIAFLGIFFAWRKKDKRIIPLLLVLLAALIPYLTLNHSSIWNTRFLPFIIVDLLLIASYGLGIMIQKITSLIKGQHKTEKRFITETILIGLIIGIIIFIQLPQQISFLPYWLQWNYEGFEKKERWSDLNQLFNYLATLPYGGVMWEYRGEYDDFGTPRVLENIPIYTGLPTYEGLLIESAISSYFHFINQAETTLTPTSAVAGFEYPQFNFDHGLRHLKLFGAQYFVAYTQDIKNLANARPQDLEKLADRDGFSIYKIKDSVLIEVVPQIALKKKDSNWLNNSIDWYKKMDFSKFYVYYQNEKEHQELKKALTSQNLLTPASNQIQIIKNTGDKLIFTTQDLYKPHLVKISYFPGWQAKGALGPYLISPSLMMVIPQETQVTLTYSYNSFDRIGGALSVITLLGLGVIIPIRRKKTISGNSQRVA